MGLEIMPVLHLQKVLLKGVQEVALCLGINPLSVNGCLSNVTSVGQVKNKKTVLETRRGNPGLNMMGKVEGGKKVDREKL